jgi:nitrogen regulatory protein P-II 1
MAQDSSTLIKIEAIVREESYLDVKNALDKIGVNGITVYQVVGCGIQRGMSEYVRGQKVEIQVVPKIKFEIVVSSEEWEKKTIEAIQHSAYTGNPGDGKIFSYYIKQAVKIRTGETGYDAVQSVKEERDKKDGKANKKRK